MIKVGHVPGSILLTETSRVSKIATAPKVQGAFIPPFPIRIHIKHPRILFPSSSSLSNFCISNVPANPIIPPDVGVMLGFGPAKFTIPSLVWTSTLYVPAGQQDVGAGTSPSFLIHFRRILPRRSDPEGPGLPAPDENRNPLNSRNLYKRVVFSDAG